MSIQINEVEDSELGNITTEEETCSSTPCAELTPTDCGMLLIRVIITPSEDLLEEDCDSDSNIKPFLEMRTLVQ